MSLLCQLVSWLAQLQMLSPLVVLVADVVAVDAGPTVDIEVAVDDDWVQSSAKSWGRR
jgi:hypothetical protein